MTVHAGDDLPQLAGCSVLCLWLLRIMGEPKNYCEILSYEDLRLQVVIESTLRRNPLAGVDYES